jgi:hypothetical protein
MMSGVALEIQSQELDDLILAAIALGDAITGNDLRLVMGTALTELVREHFYAINADSEHHTSADS